MPKLLEYAATHPVGPSQGRVAVIGGIGVGVFSLPPDLDP